MGSRSETRARDLPKRRSGDYVKQWLGAAKDGRRCKQCGAPRLRKKGLIAMLDLTPRKDVKAQRKVVRHAAAQLAGYCSAKCRDQAEPRG